MFVCKAISYSYLKELTYKWLLIPIHTSVWTRSLFEVHVINGNLIKSCLLESEKITASVDLICQKFIFV